MDTHHPPPCKLRCIGKVDRIIRSSTRFCFRQAIREDVGERVQHSPVEIRVRGFGREPFSYGFASLDLLVGRRIY